jgi:hypothetical protein
MLLTFEQHKNNYSDPAFLNIFLKKNDSEERLSENNRYSLYELKQLSQKPWHFSLPPITEGSYDLIVRAFFGNILGEYILKDIVIK